MEKPCCKTHDKIDRKYELLLEYPSSGHTTFDSSYDPRRKCWVYDGRYGYIEDRFRKCGTIAGAMRGGMERLRGSRKHLYFGCFQRTGWKDEVERSVSSFGRIVRKEFSGFWWLMDRLLHRCQARVIEVDLKFVMQVMALGQKSTP